LRFPGPLARQTRGATVFLRVFLLLGPILVALFRCPLSLLPVALVCFLLLLGKLAVALELLKPRFEAGIRVKVL
jgi:hypothetical protein